MIIRKRKINLKDTEVMLSLSFGSPDTKKWMQRFCRLLILDPDQVDYWRHATLTEQDFRYWAEHDPRVFANYEEPWRTQLSAWFFRQIKDAGYITASGTQENLFYLSEKGLKLADGKQENP